MGATCTKFFNQHLLKSGSNLIKSHACIQTSPTWALIELNSRHYLSFPWHCFTFNSIFISPISQKVCVISFHFMSLFPFFRYSNICGGGMFFYTSSTNSSFSSPSSADICFFKLLVNPIIGVLRNILSTHWSHTTSWKAPRYFLLLFLLTIYSILDDVMFLQSFAMVSRI